MAGSGLGSHVYFIQSTKYSVNVITGCFFIRLAAQTKGEDTLLNFESGNRHFRIEWLPWLRAGVDQVRECSHAGDAQVLRIKQDLTPS